MTKRVLPRATLFRRWLANTSTYILGGRMLFSRGVCNMAIYGERAFPISSLTSLKTDMGSESSATTRSPMTRYRSRPGGPVKADQQGQRPEWS